MKCGEEKPRCSNCERLDEDCDYKIRLSWGGRPLKKKQLENGANGQDPNPDDQSQFIPGAGQFSINQHFPSPQTFVQTTHNNGTTRKAPVPRVGSGKKTTMSNYQTVFSVAEPQTPPQPVMQSSTVQLDPQLRMTNGRPPPLQPQTPIMHPQNRPNPFDWEQNLTPTTATPHSTGYNDDVVYKTEHHQQGIYTPYTPVSGSFVTQIASPVSSHGNGYVHSPPGSVTSPTHYSQPQSSPPLHQQQKIYHAPPPILQTPTKRIRTSTSPTQPAPNSPFIYGNMNGHSVTMPPHTTSIGTALNYMPTSSGVSMEHHHMALMDHSAVSGVGVNTIMRRVSVENLLAAPLPNPDSSYGYVDRYPTSEMDEFKQEDSPKGMGFGVESPKAMSFGVDHGIPDMDGDSDVEEIPRHDFGGYPQPIRYNNSRMYPSGARNNGMYMNVNPNSPFYPVQITIPRRLDPLPQLLLSNKKNMMYFHHYLHYTARLLVPHDCSENPFKSILPQMAVQTDHLMNLLLAYSASHRARLLDHKEPTERIGRFLDETVRSLHASLDDPTDAKSDSTLATAIMLSSYQIISPNPFHMNGLTWQTHLSAARRIILARGGAQGMHSRDKVSYFLVRWFAYLDLLGSLSGREIDEPFFSGKYWTNDDVEDDEQEEFSVDCFFGFTGRCVSILAKIGELARQCEREKRFLLDDPSIISSHGLTYREQLELWSPSQSIKSQAMALQKELEDARGKASGHCSHTHHQGKHFQMGSPTDALDAGELLATNDAFHWAALVHLYRRVLNYPTMNPSVQNAVREIVNAMKNVRQGGTAENCLLFPLFSAGCEAMEDRHRDYTLQRMIEVEKSGLTQVRHARLLMQRVWQEDRPWWEMANGEFIG